jgi:pyruvate,water dikinase
LNQAAAKFPSPFDIPSPPGAEGWQDMYPYYLVFNEKLKDKQEAQFWFCNSQHWPFPIKPFDAISIDFAVKGVSQYNSRHLLVPPANGLDAKILNGYLYMSPVAVAPEDIAARVPIFLERAGHYYQNWDSLLANWKTKILKAIAEMEAIRFEVLPDKLPVEDIFSGKGADSSSDLLNAYDRAIQLVHEAWQYHFEFLNLGYAAYLDFFMFCKQAFPNIPDLAITKMVQGVDVELFRPDDELKKLARLAIELGVDEALMHGSVDETLAAVGKLPGGDKWIAYWESVKQPWFNFTTGNGFYSRDKYWIEHLDIPLSFIRNYIVQARRGDRIERSTEELRIERDRISAEYAEYLSGDDLATFQSKLGLSRTVFPYVENHNFYIEHWFLGTFWRKMRELSRLLTGLGFFKAPDDMFFLTRTELRDVLFDYVLGWATGAGPTGQPVIYQLIEPRMKIHAALQGAVPQPALNTPPDVITEPFTIMLWGITSETVNSWLAKPEKSDVLKGMAASPGIVEGPARIVRNEDDLHLVQDGDILVATITAPSWAAIFGKIKAAVTDIGGMMSHAAIVCREYGLPAVTATGSGTKIIRPGQRLRVDGSKGTVTLLD